MKTTLLKTQMELHHYAAFIIEGIEAVLKSTMGEDNPVRAFYLICAGVQNGNMVVGLQQLNEKPIGVYVMVLREIETGERYVEILFVYNHPNAKPKEALEEVGIPWAKENGAKVLRTISTELDEAKIPIAHRRLRGYGFTKISETFERKI